MDKIDKIDLPKHYYKYWKDLIRPKGFKVDKDTLSSTYGKFYILPLERGYGLTLGNSIRRVLLSSIMGSAVSAVKFEGVLHELSTIDGVLEDVIDIIFNLKAIRFRQEDIEDKIIKISKKGPGTVTAADMQLSAGIEVLNPEAHIATLSDGGNLEVEVIVSFDRGYIEASKKQKKLAEGYISVDAIHSPVRRVNYIVNSASVGQRTDYDSLVLEVWTDGSLKPDEAIPLGYKILKEQLQVFINFDENIEPKEVVSEESSNKLNDYLFRPAEDLELSVRSANCLKNARIRCIGDLVCKTEQEMLRTKNFGRKSLNEIKEILKPMNLSLGMEIEGWPPSDLYRRDYQSSSSERTEESQERNGEALTHSHETSNQNYNDSEVKVDVDDSENRSDSFGNESNGLDGGNLSNDSSQSDDEGSKSSDSDSSQSDDEGSNSSDSDSSQSDDDGENDGGGRRLF